MIKQDKTISISGALRQGWNQFKKHGWFMVGAFLATVLISLIVSNLVGGHSMFGEVLNNIVSIGASLFIGMGWIVVSLKLAKGQEVSWKDFYNHYKMFGKFLGATVLYWLIVAGGLILLIVPGIIWALKYRMFSYLVIEKNMDIMDALKESARLTKGARWSLLGFVIVGGLINIAGFLAFGIGAAITAPIVMVATAAVYLKLAEQSKTE